MTPRKFAVGIALTLTIAIAGCQSAKSQYGYRCTYRAIEAGYCEDLNAAAPDPINEPY
jgi:hypothetical protein